MMDFKKVVFKILTEMGVSSSTTSPSPATAPAATTPSPTTPSTTPPISEDQKDEEIAKTAKEFLKLKKGDIKTAYDKAFAALGTSIFPETEFETIVYNACKNSVRATKDYKQIPNFVAAYPLLDLASLIKQVYVEPGKGDKANEALNVLNNFTKRLSSAKLMSPLDYQAVDPWALSVRQSYVKAENKFDVGKLKLEAYSAVSIADCVYKLMNQKASSGLFKLPKKEFQQSEVGKNINTFIEPILKNPENYTSGKIPYPDKKMTAIYGEGTPEKILEIAVASQTLFDQQFQEKFERHKEDENFEINPAILNGGETTKKEFYTFFLNNKMNWSVYVKPKTQQAKESLKFDSVFDSLNLIFLKEDSTSLGFKAGSSVYKLDFDSKTKTLTATDQKTNKAYVFKENDIVQMAANYPQIQKELVSFTTQKNKQSPISRPIYNSPEEALFDYIEAAKGPNSNEERIVQQMIQNKITRINLELSRKARQSSNFRDTQPQDPNQDPETYQETFIESKYSIGDISKYKEKNEKAKALYESLEELANFIRQSADIGQIGKDFAGMAKALSLGAPEVGGKR
jgi:hypothetical protein